MDILESSIIKQDKLDEIAIDQAIDGSVLNINELIEPGDEVEVIQEFYRNVNLTNRL